MAEEAEKQGTALDVFRAQVLTPERADALWASLPRHINKDRFERNFTNALMQSPELLNHDPRLVYREVSRVAALGLLLERDLGEAYLMIAYNGKTKRLEPQARIGYRGLIKLAKQSAVYTKVYAREVHAADQYDVLQGTTEQLIHRPALHADPGEVVEYYAVAQMKDGTAEFERMTMDEIHAIRDGSEAWKAFTEGKIKRTPWADHEGEMAKKTVIRRLCKRLEQSPELTEAIRIEDEAEYPHLRDVTPGLALVAPAAPKPAIVAPSPMRPARVQPKKALTERSGTPYVDLSANKDGPEPEPKAEAEADKKATGGLHYSVEESANRLKALVDDLALPMSVKDLDEHVEAFSPTVQRLIPEHRQAAQDRLHDRAATVLKRSDGLPSYQEGGDGE